MSDKQFADFYRDRASDPVYVILGAQGSGTNLISKMMQRIFQVSIVHDRSLVLAAASRLTNGRATPARIRSEQQRVIRNFFPGPIRKRLLPRQWFHQAHRYEGIQDQVNSVSVGSAADFTHFFYGYHAFNEGKFVRGIKSDDCWDYLDAFGEAIPHRRYIFLARDPRDNLNSITKKDFGPRNIYAASLYIKRRLSMILGEIKNSGVESISTNYEVLLQRPETFVQQFSEFTGLPIPDDADEILEKLNIRRANSQKWKKWNEADLQVAETCLHDEIVELGYDLQTTQHGPIPWKDVAAFRTMDVLLRIPQRLKSVWDHKVLAK